MKSKSNGKSITKAVAPLFCVLAVGAFMSISLSACVFVRSSTIGPITGAGTPVSAEVGDYGILRLSSPDNLASTANSDLLSKCQSQLLTDVHTQLKMRDWFLLVQYYTVNANAICKPPPPAPPPPPVAQQKMVLRGVHFAFNRAVIRPEDTPVLDEAAENIKASPNVKIDVNGYCDAIGGEAYNLKLSQRRAEAVVGYLENKGVPASQLTANGHGKTNFVASNSTAEGRAQNRRVELVPEQ
jgi:outer membrane protein OmpA-like peptidoglycan-associated protein